MTKRFIGPCLLGIALVLVSALVLFCEYLVSGNWREVATYLLGDIAFLPLQVLLVTLILDRLLRARERQTRLEKLNMVVGSFFSEVGTGLLARFSRADPDLEALRQHLVVTKEWSDAQFAAVSKHLRHHACDLTGDRIDLTDLTRFLLERRGFMLGLLQSPTLLEHESFTDLLRAVFHLTEELESRDDFARLPQTDIAHLVGDMERAYGLLVASWLDYMRYLKGNYPYLFSLAMRTNPFDQGASPIVR